MKFMFDNPPTMMAEQTPDYSIPDSHLPFSDYITRCRTIIKARRTDLQQANANLILDANSPFEFVPPHPILANKRLKYGVLLVHGLLDCPFSLKDLGAHLQANGILCRSLLLPGHGTKPEDLLSVSFQDWINTVAYGVRSLQKEVDYLYLAGYSTGAALSIYQALQNPAISGIILLAPAIRIKVPINRVIAFHALKKWLHINHDQWIYKIDEEDYAKYLSLPFNAVNQVAALTDALKNVSEQHTLACPMLMAVSLEDETINSEKAVRFFSGSHHPDSKLLLYTRTPHTESDPRIINRLTQYPELNIRHFSHVSIPYTSNNPHYGQNGDYKYAAHRENKECIYGAYNRVESNGAKWLYQLGIMKNRYRQLTYNPDFEYMADEIRKFITR